MSLNNLNAKNFQIHLVSVLNPENEKSYDYLKNFFEVSKLTKLKTQMSISELQRREKIFHDMILNPTSHNVTRLKAWIDYLNWIKSVFSHKDLRYFMVLENFTRTSYADKDFCNDHEFCKLWALYFDMCSDWEEVVKFMKRNEISTKCHFFYNAIAICAEKEHNFTNANLAFLEGFDKKVENVEKLQIEYKKFEDRMEGRTNREIGSSICSTEEVSAHVEKELKLKAQNSITKDVFNENNKRLRSYNLESIGQIQHKKIKYDAVPLYMQTPTHESSLHSVNYGPIPVFIDEPYRKNVITKGTKLVEKYNIIYKYLVENDYHMRMKDEQFQKNLHDTKKKQPVSWIGGMRIPPEKIQNLANNGTDKDILSLHEEEKKVDEIINKMKNEVSNKKTKNANLNEVVNASSNVQNNINSNTNSSLPNQTKNEKTQNDKTQNDNTFETKDGMKYRMIKVEKEKNAINKETEYYWDKKIFHVKNSTSSLTYQQLLAQRHFQLLEMKKNPKESRRKTIICKVDEDGELCMDSDEEEGKEEQIEIKKSSNNLNNFPSKVNQRVDSIVESKISSKNKYLNETGKINLNLFDYPMSMEEIEERMKEVELMFTNGEINIDTRNMLYTHLEEKIVINIERMEKENKMKAAKVEPIKSFNQINNFADNLTNNIQTHTQGNTQNKKINPFLANLNIKKKEQQPDFSQHTIIPSTHQPLLELPRKKVEETTPYSNVSRSLDFTNIKVMESNTKETSGKIKPTIASLFFEDTVTNNVNYNSNNNANSNFLAKNPFYTDKAKEISISFDSTHSHLFQGGEGVKDKDDDEFSFTPKKEDSFNLMRAINIKDTPKLLKKSFTDISNANYSKSPVGRVDLIGNNNPPVGNKIHTEVESQTARQEKLSKLFGDSLGNPRKEEQFLTIPFGLSSITEKTENTYLSEDSFIFRKLK